MFIVFKLGRLIKTVVLVFMAVLVLIYIGNLCINYVLPIKYTQYVEEFSRQQELDPYFVMAIIKTESNFKERAASHKDAKGLMQLTDNTARWCAEMMEIEHYEIEMAFDPETNIKIGTWYYKYLLDKLEDSDLALAAYNGGVSNVQKWLEGGVISQGDLANIPFPETKNYVERVNGYHKLYVKYHKNIFQND